MRQPSAPLGAVEVLTDYSNIEQARFAVGKSSLQSPADEAFDPCSLCRVCVWGFVCGDAGLAAISGTYASADMAGGCA